MKKKGFTLIELLAVIVILAIIALIATPTILGVIEKARNGAASSSALSYAEALEQYIVTSELDTSKTKLNAGKYDVSAINDLVELKGNKPTSGYVTINSKGEVEAMEVAVNGYLVTCDSDTCETQNKIESEYKAYAVGDQVTIDGISYHVTKTSTKANEYVTLLRDESIGNMAFDENGGTDFETSTLKAYLDSTYKETFGDKQKYIKEITLLEFGQFEIVDKNGSASKIYPDFSEEGTYLYLYQNHKDDFLGEGWIWTKTILGEAAIIALELWDLYDETQDYVVLISRIDGCFMQTIGPVYGAAVPCQDETTGDTNFEKAGTGIDTRPVIVISKKALD